MSDLVSMGDQFKGLPMADLIGGPLKAACDSQIMLAKATADFIETVGFQPGGSGNAASTVRMATFQYAKMLQDADGKVTPYKAELNVPLLSIVKIPCLAVKKVNITFDMEVKSSFSEKTSSDKSGSLSGSAKFGFGLFSATLNISGSVSSHKENTRSSDNSAKYHVEVLAEDAGVPEGLARVMDIIQAATEPILLGENGKITDEKGRDIQGVIPGRENAGKASGGNSGTASGSEGSAS